MLATIESLLVLQERDQRIIKLNNELTAIPKQEEYANAKLNESKANYDLAKKNWQEKQVAIKKVDLDIKTRRNTLEKLQAQQFETRNNEEFHKLGDDIKRYNNDIDELETTELELMEAADELQKSVDETQKTMQLVQASIDDDICKLHKRAEVCRGQLDELQQERAQLGAKVDSGDLDLYERLLKSKDGQAIAQVVDKQCSGCHMKLVPNTLSSIQAETGLVLCENCSRILYL